MPSPVLGAGDAAENETRRLSLLQEEEGWETANTQANLRKRGMRGEEVLEGEGPPLVGAHGCPLRGSHV